MPTALHVTAAAIAVLGCLAVSYSMFLAAMAASNLGNLSMVHGLMNVM